MDNTQKSYFLTPAQLAERWQVSKATLYSKLSRGEPMPKRFKIGNYVRFNIRDIEAFERKRTQ